MNGQDHPPQMCYSGRLLCINQHAQLNTRDSAMAKRSQPRLRRRLPLQKSVGIDDEGRLDEATLRRFVFQTFGRARRTQDSPVMPDVWLRYIRIAERISTARSRDRTNDTIDLLLTPWSGVRPGEIAKRMREGLTQPSKADEKKRGGKNKRLSAARIALSDSRVVACVDFETLVRNVVPLTGWWQRLFRKKGETETFDKVFKRIEDSVEKNTRPPGSHIELFRYAALV